MSAALNEAKRLAGLGFSVIPVMPKGKSPLVEWEQFQHTRADVDQIERWWAEHPSANLGVVTGEVSGIVVVDVDDRERLAEVLAVDPTEYIVTTGKGYHLYYRHPGGTRIYNRVRAKDGIDVRADGGIVVVPPSVHSSGRAYSYYSQGEIGVIPDWVFHPQTGTNQGGSMGYWIQRALAGVTKGERNTTCTRLAGYYYARRIPADIAVAMLLNWDSFNDPPLGEGVIRLTVQSTYNTAEKRNMPAPSPIAASSISTVKHQQRADGSLLIPTQPDEQYVVGQWQADAVTELTVFPLDQYASQFVRTNDRWQIQDWLPEATVALMVAPPGNFKTWVGMGMLTAVATGHPFLGKYPVQKGPVLVFQQEDAHNTVYGRIRTIQHYYRWGEQPIAECNDGTWTVRTVPEPPIYIHPYKALSLLNLDSLKRLEDAIKTLGIKLVYIDPLYTLGSVDDYFAKTAQHFSILKALRDKYGVTFLVTHHTKKSSKDDRGDKDRQQAWGSQFLNAALETGIQIREVPGEEHVAVHRHYKDAPNPNPLTMLFDIDTGSVPRFEVTVKEVQPDTRSDDKTPSSADKILDWLENNGPSTAADLARGVGVSRSTVTRNLKPAMERGQVTKNADDTYEYIRGGMIQ